MEFHRQRANDWTSRIPKRRVPFLGEAILPSSVTDWTESLSPTGGLLIDFELLRPNIPALLESFSLPVPSESAELPSLLEVPPLDPSHSAVVEMRAVTIIMLDRLATGIRKKLGVELTLPQVLEAGTWKAVRALGPPPSGFIPGLTLASSLRLGTGTRSCEEA